MPAIEIMSRCRGLAQGWQDRLALSIRREQKNCDFQSVSRTCGTLIPGLSSSEIRTLAEEFPHVHSAMSESILSASKQVMSGRISLLGQAIDISDPDWHKDPLSEFRWPESFYGDVQIYELPADVKYVWEVSRHQFLPSLAQAWLLSGDDSHPVRAQQLIASWIEKNPVYVGVNWTSGLEVALRAISWVWTIAGLQSWNGWEKPITDQITRSMADHAHYLSGHLSYYSSPYNHLVGEASALYMLGVVLADHPSARRWRKLARQVLTNHGSRQFYDDGFTVEQATGYHFFTLGFFLQAIIAARQVNAPFESLENAVERAVIAGAVFRRPDQRWPAVGDLDSARSIPCGHTDFWDFGGLCGLAGALFENKHLAERFRESETESFWMLGCQGVRWLKSIPETNQPTQGILPNSGYACWSNSQGDWVMLDCGPIGDGVHADETPSVAHGHDDALSVHLAFKKENILQDCGMLRYAGSREWVDFMRSESAHNRIIVEGVAGAKNAGRLAWSHVQQETEISARLGSETAFLHGKLKIDGVTIDRHVFMGNDTGLWIADFIELDRPRSVQWHWHMPGSAALSNKSASAICGSSFQLRTWCSEDFDNTIVAADESQPEAWIALGYGSKTKGYLARQRIACPSRRAVMVTHIGDPMIRMRIGFGDAQSLPLDADTSRLPSQEFDNYFRWEVVSPEQEVYLVGKGQESRKDFGTPVDGLGELVVRQPTTIPQ